MSEEKKVVEKTAQELTREKAAADFLAFEKSVPKMSHRQLLKDLRRRSRARRAGKDFCMNAPKGVPLENTNCAGLDNAFAAILGVVLENTHTQDPRRFRKDQINPNGRISPMPR